MWIHCYLSVIVCIKCCGCVYFYRVSASNAKVQVQNAWLKIPGCHDGTYKLSGMVVHRQLSLKLGHYVAFVRSLSAPDQWFYANDSQVQEYNINNYYIYIGTSNLFQVTPVSIASVLLQSPYMLFYSKGICLNY